MSQDLRPQRPPDPGARGGAPLNPWLAAALACAAVVLLLVAGVAVQRYASREPAAATKPPGTAAPARPTTKPATKPTTKPPPGIGDPVRDGKFEFVVTRVDCSRTTLGQEHLKRTAKGKFCIVGLSVRDIADGSQFFIGHAQKAFDATGAAYGNDEIAGIYANRDTETFLRKLDPGEKVTGNLVFDLPRQARLTRLELHDSLLSGGVEVTVG